MVKTAKKMGVFFTRKRKRTEIQNDSKNTMQCFNPHGVKIYDRFNVV